MGETSWLVEMPLSEPSTPEPLSIEALSIFLLLMTVVIFDFIYCYRDRVRCIRCKITHHLSELCPRRTENGLRYYDS